MKHLGSFHSIAEPQLQSFDVSGLTWWDVASSGLNERDKC